MKRLLLGVVAMIADVSAAAAQTQEQLVDAFSGQWQVYEQAFASGQALCTLSFSSLPAGSGGLGLHATGCSAALKDASSWSIEGGQLVLRNDGSSEIARLGGNQKRITGATPAGVPLILERAGGDGTAATLQGAYNASGCYYLGYTADCAPRAQLGEPQASPDGRIQIQMQANLFAYPEPRVDPGSTVGQVQQGSCIVVDACTMASDGPWCRANFGAQVGWLRKFTLRQNRWPVITFTNACQ